MAYMLAELRPYQYIQLLISVHSRCLKASNALRLSYVFGRIDYYGLLSARGLQ